jgi:hypothetical protein
VFDVDETSDLPTIVYTEPQRPIPAIPPVQDPSRSKYGNNPDISKMHGKLRADALNAMRQRRHQLRLKEGKADLERKLKQQDDTLKR